MSGRDPRREPRAGDVLRKGRVTREARGFWRDTVTFWRSVAGTGAIYQLTTRLASWRRWAAGAEVLRTGEEE